MNPEEMGDIFSKFEKAIKSSKADLKEAMKGVKVTDDHGTALHAMANQINKLKNQDHAKDILNSAKKIYDYEKSKGNAGFNEKP